MKKDKLVYEAPEAEIYEVRFSDGNVLMSSGGYNSSNHTEYITGSEADDGYEKL